MRSLPWPTLPIWCYRIWGLIEAAVNVMTSGDAQLGKGSNYATSSEYFEPALARGALSIPMNMIGVSSAMTAQTRLSHYGP
jgi:hypothetical protein